MKSFTAGAGRSNRVSLAPMKSTPILISKRDNIFQRIEVLKTNRTKRHRYQEFFVEGVRNINALEQSGWPLAAICLRSRYGISDWAKEFLSKYPSVPYYQFPEELFNELSGKDEPGELIVVAKMLPDEFERISFGQTTFCVVFDRPQSPGNLGTIIRSIDALGGGGLIITGHGADLYDPQTVQASVGSLFRVPCIRAEGSLQVFEWIKCLKETLPNTQVVSTSAKGSRTYREYDFSTPTILVIGNEGRGVSKAYMDGADTVVTIPMCGGATSLNVSCSLSVLLAEAYFQREG